LCANPGNGKVVLDWAGLSGASSYKVKRSNTKSGPYTTIKTGLTSSAYTDWSVDNGKVYYYVVCAVKNGSDTANSSECSAIPGAALPSPAKTKDIGNVAETGGASYSNGKFTVIGSGNDIWNNSDEFRYVYVEAYKDCTVVARVASVEGTHGWAKAGVMIRDTLQSGAEHASMFVTPANGVAFQYRSSTDGSSGNANTTGPSAPYWVKIVRDGNTFTGYASPNGANWTKIGSQWISMTSSVYIGLAVTSHNDGTLCTAVFDNVTVSP
jgi:hypothetical protein